MSMIYLQKKYLIKVLNSKNNIYLKKFILSCYFFQKFIILTANIFLKNFIVEMLKYINIISFFRFFQLLTCVLILFV